MGEPRAATAVQEQDSAENINVSLDKTKSSILYEKLTFSWKLGLNSHEAPAVISR